MEHWVTLMTMANRSSSPDSNDEAEETGARLAGYSAAIEITDKEEHTPSVVAMPVTASASAAGIQEGQGTGVQLLDWCLCDCASLFVER